MLDTTNHGNANIGAHLPYLCVTLPSRQMRTFAQSSSIPDAMMARMPGTSPT